MSNYELDLPGKPPDLKVLDIAGRDILPRAKRLSLIAPTIGLEALKPSLEAEDHDADKEAENRLGEI
jgi:hypothetical protein